MTTDARLPSSQAFDHLVYLRVFEGCNLHCQHCFIPSNPKRMTLEDIERVPGLLSERLAPDSTILLQWHGGEPTLMGVDFIRDGIRKITEAGEGFDWRHGIQTNLMNFDDRWADLYHAHFGSEVGISWDPRIRLLNRHSPESHAEYNRRFEERLEHLLARDLTPYLVVTATKTLFQSFPNPFEFFQYWQDRGVSHVHLERVTQTGMARIHWDMVGLDNATYARNMARWLKAYAIFRKKNGIPFFLSPFDGLMDSAQSLGEATARRHGCLSGHCDTKFHTIDADGYKTGCTALTSEQGNRRTNQVLDLGSNLRALRTLRTFACASCPFRSICSSGCLALNFDDGSGECSGSYHLLRVAAEITGTLPDDSGPAAPYLKDTP